MEDLTSETLKKSLEKYKTLKKVFEMADLNLHIELALQKFDEFIDSLEEESANNYPLEGPFEFNNQSTYFGQLKNGQPNGFGEEIRVDGEAYYAGFWDKGKKIGKCLLAFTKNSFFLSKSSIESDEVIFILNKSDLKGTVHEFTRYEGEGYMELMNGKNYETPIFKYEGRFKDSILQGAGAVYNAEGIKLLEGKFEKGEIRKGTIFDNNGKKKYKGDFVNSLPHGYGISYDNKGQNVFEGHFSNGFFFQNDKIYFLSGEIFYEGEIKDELPEGRGTLYSNENQQKIYKGFFKRGKKEGEGEELVNGKIVYKGQFMDGKRHGKGVIFDKDGKEIYRGQFLLGKIHDEDITNDPNLQFRKLNEDCDTQDG